MQDVETELCQPSPTREGLIKFDVSLNKRGLHRSWCGAIRKQLYSPAASKNNEVKERKMKIANTVYIDCSPAGGQFPKCRVCKAATCRPVTCRQQDLAMHRSSRHNFIFPKASYLTHFDIFRLSYSLVEIITSALFTTSPGLKFLWLAA